MSRIGRQPIEIPEGVTIDHKGDSLVVQGPRGSLQQPHLSGVKYDVKDNQFIVTRVDDGRIARSQHGLMRSLVFNMVVGVTQGFEKRLQVIGIGYKVRIEESDLVLNLGFSHEIRWSIPDDLQVEVKDNIISVSGIDKQRVGQAAATIRSFKKPEPYKGKGIRYQGEAVRRKSGKGGAD